MRSWPRNLIAQAARRRGTAVLWVGLVLLALSGSPAKAASPAVSPAASAGPPEAAPAVAELEQLIDTLQDDKTRAALISQLRALIAAQRASTVAPSEPDDVVGRLSRRFTAAAGEVLAGVAVLLDAPLLLAWVQWQMSDVATRARWFEVTAALLVVFGLGLGAAWIVRHLLKRLLLRAPTSFGDSRTMRLLLLVLAIVIETLPVAAFAAVATTALAVTAPRFAMARYAVASLVYAMIAVQLICAVARALLVPSRADWPHLPLGEETRNYLLIWVRRFAGWTVFGYAAAAAAWWLGVPGGVHGLMLKIAGLVVAILAIVFVLQNRASVAGWIAGAPPTQSDGWARLRSHIGELWHILAIVYIGGIYLAYALRIEGGSGYFLGATLVSLVVIVGARLLTRFITKVSRRGFAIAPELKARFPLLEQRANRYLPILTGFAGAAIYALALLTVLQAWDIRSFAWFQTEFGRKTAGALMSIAVVLAIAFAAWEVLVAVIERHLAGLDASATAGRMRRRTLLPLLRTTMLCIIFVIAALTILSEVGLNIGPLLAGAGMIGVAVGFGSQALVKDVITGLLILVEDQVAVGDIVDLGKDHKGVVEAISIRTIRLRDQAGVVHTVPFSDVTSVKNMSRDFAYAVARIGIAYGEDVDRVAEILRGVSEALMADEEIGPSILDPFDYQGIESLDESAVTLLLRVRTLPGKQFAVGRALNRLIKDAFAKHAVAMRDPPAPIILTGPTGAPPLADRGTADAPRRTA
jgi:moderate conductance mechanosensitive channel